MKLEKNVLPPSKLGHGLVMSGLVLVMLLMVGATVGQAWLLSDRSLSPKPPSLATAPVPASIWLAPVVERPRLISVRRDVVGFTVRRFGAPRPFIAHDIDFPIPLTITRYSPCRAGASYDCLVSPTPPLLTRVYVDEIVTYRHEDAFLIPNR